MINKKIFNIIGYVLLFLAISMLFSLSWSFYDNTNDFYALLKSCFVTICIALLLILLTQFTYKRTFPFIRFSNYNRFDFSARDGYILVALSWIIMSACSALPFYFYEEVVEFENIKIVEGIVQSSGNVGNNKIKEISFDFTYIDSFFEAMSGLTTTGATIFSGDQIDSAPRGLMFWRSFTQFIGGIGIIVFSIAILPLLGFGGVQLFRAEVAGPIADKLTPRVKQTAKLLWGIYIGLIVSETIILMFEGVTFYDSITHSFATMATGGFSTHSNSILYFPSIIQYTIMFFMVLAATSFSLHFLAFRKGKIEYFKDQEFRVYIFIISLFLVIFFTDNYLNNLFLNKNIENNFRHSLFTSISLLTTTGFSTLDYETWGYTSQTMVFILLFIGGCAGSTTGGIKIIRTILVFKFLSRELKKLIHPKGIFHIKIGKNKISEEVISNTVGFYLFYIFIFVFSSSVFAFLNQDLKTSLSISASAIGNIGPGLGSIGPSNNWSNLPDTGKVIASFLMLLGRLEIFTVMLLFFGGITKK